MPPNLIVRTSVAGRRTYSFAAKKASGQTSGILDPEKGCFPRARAALSILAPMCGSPNSVLISRPTGRAHDGHDDRRTETEMHQSQRLLR